LKSDLCDKKNLMETLSKEREALAKLEAEFKDLQSKFFNLKEKSENEEEQVETIFLGETTKYFLPPHIP